MNFDISMVYKTRIYTIDGNTIDLDGAGLTYKSAILSGVENFDKSKHSYFKIGQFDQNNNFVYGSEKFIIGRDGMVKSKQQMIKRNRRSEFNNGTVIGCKHRHYLIKSDCPIPLNKNYIVVNNVGKILYPSLKHRFFNFIFGR